MPRPLEFDIHNVVGVQTDADGFLSFVHDDEGELGGAAVPVQHWHGLWSAPLEAPVDADGQPDPTQSAASLTAYEGGMRHCFALSSPSVIGNLPIGVPGETIVHNSIGAFSRYHRDGSISHATTTTGGGSDGQTVADRVTPTAHIRFGPWGRETFDATGYRIKHAGGARLALAYAGGLPGVPGLSSYARMQAHIIEINGTTVSIGPTGALQQPVVQALPLQVLLGEIVGALQAVQAAAANIPGGGAAMAPAEPIVAAAIAAVAAMLPAVSTTTAIG